MAPRSICRRPTPTSSFDDPRPCVNLSSSSPAPAAEISHGLVARLSAAGTSIITLDVTPLDASVASQVAREFTGSITDVALLDRILAEFEVDCVFHLAALLSTRSEFTPVTAHHVNVEGTLNLLEFAQRQGESHGRPVVFVYPSSIAAYGLPDLETKARGAAGRAKTISRTRRRCTGATSCIASSSAATTRGHYKQLSADAIRARGLPLPCGFPG